ncbi:MAG: hypothetical protein QHH24_07540 [Candidatus Bathyarchaeota archaeon]|nr:hypothetical protein [Candidatus Bathyarchaeota archaeon]
MTQNHAEPINRGVKNRPQTNRGVKELIETEWKIIEKLQKLATKTPYDKAKGFYYQTLASHVRTLSILLKLHAPEQSIDLAQLLSQITTEAKTLAKRLKKR